MNNNIRRNITIELWREFEKMSIDIILIDLKVFNRKIITSSRTTQKTRDRGIDGIIQLFHKNREYTVTIEAKLREKSKKISLRDIATSIIYHLINPQNTNVHFFVTNVVFTSETEHVIMDLQNNLFSDIRYIDGIAIKEILSSHELLKKKYPELANYIKTTIFKKKTTPNDNGYLSNTDETKIKEKFLCNERKILCENIENSFINKNKLIIIQGVAGSGKSFISEVVIQKVEKKLFNRIIKIDLQGLRTIEEFYKEMIRKLFSLDIRLLTNILGKDKDLLLENIEKLNFRKSLIPYIESIKYIFELEACDCEITYYVRIFLEELCNKYFKKNRVLIKIENLDRSFKRILNFLNMLLPVILNSNVYFLIEISDSRIDEFSKITANDWERHTKLLKNIHYNQKKAKSFLLDNYSEAEALLFIKFELPGLPKDYYESVINRIGYNPYDLTNAIQYIRNNKLYSILSINKMLSSDLVNLIRENLIYFITYRDDNKRECYQKGIFICFLLDGSIPFNLFPILFEGDNIEKAVLDLKKTSLLTISHLTVKFVHSTILDVLFSLIKSNEYVTSLICKYSKLLLRKIDNIYGKSETDDIGRKVKELELFYYSNDQNLLKRVLEVSEELTIAQNPNKALELIEMALEQSKNLFYQETNDENFLLKLQLSYLKTLDTCLDLSSEKANLIFFELEEYFETQDFIRTNFSEEYWFLKTEFHYLLFQKNYQKLKFIEAEKNIKDAFSTANQICSLTPKVSLMHKLYRSKALSAKRKGDTKECLAILSEGAKHFPNTIIEISLYAHLGAFSCFNNPQESIQHALYARDIAIKSRNIEMISWMSNDLAMYYFYCKDYQKAFVEAKKTSISSEKFGFLADVGRAYNILACINLVRKEFKKATLNFDKALHFLELSGNNTGLFVTLINSLYSEYKEAIIENGRIEEILILLKQNQKDFQKYLMNIKKKKSNRLYGSLIEFALILKKLDLEIFLKKLINIVKLENFEIHINQKKYLIDSFYSEGNIYVLY